MNLEQLRAKYGNVEGTKPATKSNKVWSATKTAATKTGGFIYGIAPATNRRVNSIAEELNTQLNNHEFELFKHQVMIEMIAQKTGVNLPDDETLFAYFEEEQENNQPVAESKESVDSLASKVFDAVISKLKKVPVEEKTVEEEIVEEVKAKPVKETKPRNKRKDTKKEQPQEAEVIEDYSEEAAEARAKEEALAKQGEDKKPRGRRKLGRQAPLTTEEE